MRLADRLNSFPVIVVAALLLAALFGLGMGFVTSSGTAPTLPQTVAGGNAADSVSGAGGPLESRDIRRATNSNDRKGTGTRGNRSDPVGTNGGANDPGSTNGGTVGPDGVTPPPVKAGDFRKLPEGRVDEIETLVDVEQPHSSIEVSVTDSRGVILPFALLALDVRSGPLGWHLVPSQPQAVPEQRGLFRFANLYPGEYRVRSLATNYKPVEQAVRLQGAEDVESISLILEPLEYAQVEFFVHFADSVIPQEVELRIDKPGQEDTSTQGRFHEYKQDPAVTSRALGVIPPTRMRQATGNGGMIKLTLPKDQTSTVTFAADRDDQRYEGSVAVTPTGGITQQDVTLQPTDAENDGILPRNPTVMGNLYITLTVAGEPAEFTAVNLRKSVDDFTYRPPSTTEGSKYVWQSLYEGQWFIVAESAAFHAPYVAEINVAGETRLNLDIRTGHLRVNAVRAGGTPDPQGDKQARYRVRLRPWGSGTIERAYNGNLTGKQTDFIDFIVPVGPCDVRVESPENYPKLAVTPVQRDFEMTPDGEVALSFTLSAATHLLFQCVDGNGAPVQNAEYLITFNPAGQVPEAERANVGKAGYNGICETDLAPSGPVYIMIWATSTDWANPDKVFEVNLPAYAERDLGAVVVTE